MGKRDRRRVGEFEATDEKGQTHSITVLKRGRSVWIETFYNMRPLSELVHPSNTGSADGWMREMALCWPFLKEFKHKPMR